MNLSDDDLNILISCVGKQITRFDETWGDAVWRRENSIDRKAAYYQTQAEARDRAGDLLARLKTERGV
jgi:hypothetical protein